MPFASFILGLLNSAPSSSRSSWPVGSHLYNRIPVKNIKGRFCLSYVQFKQGLEKLEACGTEFPLSVEGKRNVRETLWH